jgi:hypothetical protein|tara:strand:+ start:2215 stop:2487 length:273 start_codon:yes stop_codon:yes gene_type:complete
MLIYTIEVQDGERTYYEWNFDRERNYVDYLEGKITDRDLLYDVYGTELEDSDCIDLEQKTKSYQIGDVIASIENVNSITEEHLEIVRRYV